MGELHPNDIELLEYFEGEADPTTAETIRRHVESCADCSELVTLLAAGRSALASSSELELSRDRIAQTLGSLGPQEPRPRPQWLRPRRLAAVLAPVAAVAALVAIVATVDFGSAEQDAAVPAPAPAAGEAPAPAELRADDESPGADGSSASSDEAGEGPREPAAAAEPAQEAAPESLTDLGSGLLEEDAAPPPAPAPAAPAEPRPEEPARAADMPAPEPAPAPAEPAPAPPPAPAEEPPPLSDAQTVRLVKGPPKNVVALLSEAGFGAAVNEDGAVEVVSSDAAAVEQALAARADGKVAVVLVTP